MPSAPSIDIGRCLSEGWELYKREPMLLSGATFLVAAINIAVSFIPFATLVTYPLLVAGLYLMIMRIDRGETVAIGDLFDALPIWRPLILASLLMSLLITVGLFFLVLPGLYLALAYGFTTLLIVDRQMESWPAMEASRKVITAHFWNYFLLALVLLLICFVGSIPLGLGLLVAAPVCLAAQYRFYCALNELY